MDTPEPMFVREVARIDDPRPPPDTPLGTGRAD